MYFMILPTKSIVGIITFRMKRQNADHAYAK
jgi:hypothetical protein